MKISVLLILLLCVMCACSSNRREEVAEEKSDFPQNPDWRWVLTVPKNTESCELWFSFQHDGKLKFSYRGFLFDGSYHFDAELPNYLYINIPDRFNWNDDCIITPDYLTLYNDNTDFSWTVIGDFMYFQKMEKVLTFKKEIIAKI